MWPPIIDEWTPTGKLLLKIAQHSIASIFCHPFLDLRGAHPFSPPRPPILRLLLLYFLSYSFYPHLDPLSFLLGQIPIVEGPPYNRGGVSGGQTPKGHVALPGRGHGGAEGDNPGCG